jgi:SAM-dependent methyltransferase
MSDGIYRNQQHYIVEGWSAQPKESFKALKAIISERKGLQGLRILDVGCATGELLGYLSSQIADSRFVGVDVAPELIETAARLLRRGEFRLASALDLPADFAGAFDVVCAMGCMSIFDETMIDGFWENLLKAARPGGLVVVLSPLNEFGVDAMIRHRKRRDGAAGPWETGWNIFSQDTIKEIVARHGAALELRRFEIPFELAPREDPVRTWTVRTEHRERQLTNGLKLLIDHYFMIARPALP